MTHTASIPTVTETAPADPVKVSRPGKTPMNYPALISMMLMSFLLVTAEFLPGGMLTRIADGLSVTSGQAGQMVTVTALAGLLAAPTVGLLFPKLDRRSLLTWLAVTAAISNLLVAVLPNLILVILARFLLGAALSAFWAMSISVAAKIAGPERLGKAVMFNSAGVSLATVAGVPLGVTLAEYIDWRGVFLVAAAASALLAIALRWLLPSVPAEHGAKLSALWVALRRPGIAFGVIANMLVVTGHFLAYTYVRIALEQLRDGGEAIGADTIVLLLALFGVGGLVGNFVFGAVADRLYRVLAVLTPVVLAGLLLLVQGASASLLLTSIAVVFWGFFFASWLLVVNTWAGKRMPDMLEPGGTLVVVGFQSGIMIAAGVGGAIVDALGVGPVFLAGTALLLLGAVFFATSDRITQRHVTR
ncbi:MFS transporter [Leucobacter sp. UT-8R-CII-1-4]|uniref:MFS transporter n=1 Tax=Leucobacter sp. UT-8R-CII-1-4 TaxID=3040075 RepID=UPI0024A91060|nr:MFS transporter [Leucobacter sp. UT-8R-CII-1-4]MDI6022546.1 MFS transporter [Leucobacter sp. UT-8R-CII-1-4]